MFWNILLVIIGLAILVLGILNVLLKAKQEQFPNRKRDLIITLVLTGLVWLYPIIQVVKPSKTDEILGEVRELRREIGEPTRYEDGIPQSENLNLRKLFEVGKTHLNNYEYDEAIKAFRAGLALHDMQPSEAAALLIHIGIAQHKQSKWDEAEGAYKEALDWAEKGKDEGGQAAALGNLGTVYHDKGEWSKAIEFYEKDLTISKKIGDEHGMAGIFNNLGLLYKAKGEWDKAMEFYEKSLEINEKIGDEHGMAQTKANIGIFYKEQGEKAQARRLLEESLKVLERIGDKPNAEIVKSHLEELQKEQSGDRSTDETDYKIK